MRWVRVTTETGAALCIAEVADGWWTRFRGLMGRKRLAKGQGLWIKPSNSIQTTFMRFPIDLVYLDPENQVAKTCSRVRPWRFSFGGREAKTVLELAPGALDQVPLRVGEQLRIEPLEGRADDTRKTGDLAGPPPAEVTR